MQSKNLSAHQFGAIIFILLIGNKLLVLPSILYDTARNDAFLFMFVTMIIDYLSVLLFVYANNKSKNICFLERSQQVFGKFFSKFFSLIFILFFLLKAYLTLKETENFLNTTIYTYLDSEMFIIPIILVAIYVVSKGIKNVGRTSEVFAYPVFIGLIVSLLIAIPNINLDGILPLGTSTFNDWISLFLHAGMWFGNYFVIYFLIGRVDLTEKPYKTATGAFLIGAVLVLGLFWCFYSIFESSSVLYHFAISDITSFAPSLSSLAKIDWFTVIFYGFAMILQLILYFYVIVKLIEHIFERKFNVIFYIIFSIMLILAYILIPVGFNKSLEFSSNVLGLPATILNLLIFILMLFMYVFKIKHNKIKPTKNLKSKIKVDFNDISNMYNLKNKKFHSNSASLSLINTSERSLNNE